ncbi:MAG: dihydrofolate reductase family protein [Pyrinomonadaceae bacterium]
MASSLDGMIAKPDNSVGWFETKDEYEDGIELSKEDSTAFLKTIDCYVMGSKTYELALDLSREYGWGYGDTPTKVLTSRNLPVERPGVELYSGDLDTFVSEVLRPNYRNVWVAGGSMVAKEFLRAGLADEIRLSVLPIILGGGKPFFEEIGREIPLHLKDVKAYKTGIVEMVYEILKT